MKSKTILLTVALGLLMSAIAAPAAQVPIYSVKDIRQPNGKIVSHPVGTDDEAFGAWAINDLGQVLGRDFVNPNPPPDGNFYNNVIIVQPGGSYRTITNAGFNNFCFPRAMNVLGQSVGDNLNLYWDDVYQSPLYDDGDAMLYNPDGKSVVLGNLFPGITPEGRTSGSIAYGINSSGVIVGYCQSVFNNDVRGFVYQKGKIYDLNGLVNRTGVGFKITSATGINDFGQIVATATDSAGKEHAVILSVVGMKASDVLK